MSRIPPPTHLLPPHLRLGRSEVHGYGLFARSFIPRGEAVIEYFGERISKAETRRREARQLALRAAGKEGCFYIFTVNERFDIDGDVPWNPARRMNHSCSPNCESHILRGRVWIVARQDIAAGAEVTYDYGFPYKGWRDHPCRCGAADCVGYIVGASQRWRVRRILKKEEALFRRAQRDSRVRAKKKSRP